MHYYRSVERETNTGLQGARIFKRKDSNIVVRCIVGAIVLCLYSLCQTRIKPSTEFKLADIVNNHHFHIFSGTFPKSSQPDNVSTSTLQLFRSESERKKANASPENLFGLLRPSNAEKELASTKLGVAAVPDLRNVTEVNIVYLSMCVTAITVVCLEIPFVPGCHGCETYVARIAINATHSPKENHQLDVVCNLISGSGLCDFMDDIPICPICEALSEDPDAETESRTMYKRTSSQHDRYILQR